MLARRQAIMGFVAVLASVSIFAMHYAYQNRPSDSPIQDEILMSRLPDAEHHTIVIACLLQTNDPILAELQQATKLYRHSSLQVIGPVDANLGLKGVFADEATAARAAFRLSSRYRDKGLLRSVEVYRQVDMPTSPCR